VVPAGAPKPAAGDHDSTALKSKPGWAGSFNEDFGLPAASLSHRWSTKVIDKFIFCNSVHERDSRVGPLHYSIVHASRFNSANSPNCGVSTFPNSVVDQEHVRHSYSLPFPQRSIRNFVHVGREWCTHGVSRHHAACLVAVGRRTIYPPVPESAKRVRQER
jgi:hypothetical protein